MILTLNQSFNEFFIEQLLAFGCTSYREVYRGRMADGKLVFLTVYDLQAMPVCMETQHIDEFELSSKLTDDLFPRFIKEGRETMDERTLVWMATEYVDAPISTLRELHERITLNEKQAVYFLLDLLKGVWEVACRTGSGGIYNLNLDTVGAVECSKVNPEEDGLSEYRPILLDLSCASEPCSGSPTFDTSTLDPLFRARETYLGRFNTCSDIYAVGVLMAYLLSDGQPYPVSKEMDSFKLGRIVSETDPDIQVTDELKSIIRKAVRVNVARRYHSVDAFIRALEKFAPQWREERKVVSISPNEEDTSLQNSRRRFMDRTPSNPDELKREEEVPSFSQAQPQVLRVLMEVKQGLGFEAVAGMEDLKKKLHRDFIDIIAHRDLASKYDIVPPNLLLYGPPGTGKTYISMRLAEECEMECSIVNPSDLGSIYVHGSQSLIKDLFLKAEGRAKKNGKGVLLIFDEFDAFCPQRTPEDRNNQAGEVAEFLVQLNNCYERNIFVIGTTNCLDRVDKAVIRKGRIDEVIFIGMPDKLCRRQIFELELTKRPHDESIDLDELAVMTDGFTSGDIAYLVKETARSGFEASLQREDKEPVKITQAMLESVIRDSASSVSRSDIKKYEKMRDSFIKERKKEGQKVGFFA